MNATLLGLANDSSASSPWEDEVVTHASKLLIQSDTVLSNGEYSVTLCVNVITKKPGSEPCTDDDQD